MKAYYNEHDPKAAAWLRELIKHGHIANGDVDERSIEDVVPTELAGYTQCHFFAGIGVWSYSLRRAGWPDDRQVWTGSCPCQPFSAAGKAGGFDDERHLWPAFFHLLQQCRPATVFGEQVASKDGLAWLDLVHADLEGAGYSVGALDLCAAGFGAPHIRQRIFFVGQSDSLQSEQSARPRARPDETQSRWSFGEPARPGDSGILADTEFNADRSQVERHDSANEGERSAGRAGGFCDAGILADAKCGATERHGLQLGIAARGTQGPAHERQRFRNDARDGSINGVAQGDTEPTRLEGHGGDVGNGNQPGRIGAHAAGSATTSSAVDNVAHPGSPRHSRSGPGALHGERDSAGPIAGADGCGPVNGFWHPADWIPCRDGKWRPVEPGTFPLAHGAPARVGRLRGYGNAIVAPVAQGFIEAYLDVTA